MAIYGYARCSTNEDKQDINRQIRELKDAGAEEVVFEYEHGDAKVKKNLHVLLDTTNKSKPSLLSPIVGALDTQTYPSLNQAGVGALRPSPIFSNT